MNKKITLATLIITTLLSWNCSKNTALNNYPTKKYIDSDDMILLFYRSPIMATKILSNKNNKIEKISYINSPQKIGYINTNNIVIYKENSEDSMNFKFNKVSYYRIKTADKDSFSIAYIKANYNKEVYEIVLELRDPVEEDRILFIYKKGIPILIISYPDYMFNYSKRYANSI